MPMVGMDVLEVTSAARAAGTHSRTRANAPRLFDLEGCLDQSGGRFVTATLDLKTT